MSDFIKSKTRTIGFCIAFVLMVLTLAACAQEKNKTSVAGNDTAVRETLKAFDPVAEAKAEAGKSIAGSEEEKLQQERIAGGAVTEVVSKNLQPLEGITDFSKGATTATYGIDLQAPAVEHNYGTRCLSCHSVAEAGTEVNLKVKLLPPQLPPGHASAKLKEADCTTCHKVSRKL